MTTLNGVQSEQSKLPSWQDDDDEYDDDETRYIHDGEEWFSFATNTAAVTDTDFATGLTVQLLWDMASTTTAVSLPPPVNGMNVHDDDMHGKDDDDDDDDDDDVITTVTTTTGHVDDSSSLSPNVVHKQNDEWMTDEDMTDSDNDSDEWDTNDVTDHNSSDFVVIDNIIRHKNSEKTANFFLP